MICPTEVSPLLVVGDQDIRGCGSENVTFDQGEKVFVCSDCGLYFTPEAVADDLSDKPTEWFIEQYNENALQE